MYTHRLIFPGSVLRGRGAIAHLGRMCGRLGQRALLVGGKRALAFAEPLVVRQLEESGVSYLGSEWYGGECSETQILRLSDLLERHGVEVVIAAGGGRALDTAKAAAVQCHIPVMTLPTVASTCAAMTPLVFRYHDDGQFRDMQALPEGPAAAVIDADILARTPLPGFAAGLGDTLAKWYEYRAVSATQANQALAGVVRAHSELCHTLIAAHAADACAAVRAGQANAALEQVLDAVFLYAGLTSVMSNGGHTGAAHALYEGFTGSPRTRHVAHGLLVGFGNLCLLALEQRHDHELIAAIGLARAAGIPASLEEIAPGLTPPEIAPVLQRAVRSADMANMPFPVDVPLLQAAIDRVHRLAAQGV
ncbi:iron-containing alcohol dehydrogenase family protein [Chimaeribacter arupi]|uniref:iron-containing alcohol dehydrogenase family protein n=1 Tax=Chimaeribacter arupi TaxID=2060066 RepID=UPI002711E794|nr:iron-containing alcohol dehydrogenase family protein [Chimaeribacter arupi]WKZ90683.1 iron-containing alcohol dehydrogenase family protein [Chimaeribacter arupi]